MSTATPSWVSTLALFEQRFTGDDCLLKLTARRFADNRMGAEMHGGSSHHLDWVLSFRPSNRTPVVFHLPRDFNITDESTRSRVGRLAQHFAGTVSGFVLHDHQDLVQKPKKYLDAARHLNGQFTNIQHAPMLFIEYAAGLAPEQFAQFFTTTRGLTRIGPCIDIGHVGIRAARSYFAERHAGEDVCDLKSQPQRLPELMPDIEAAVAQGVDVVCELTRELSQLNKPIHFHLHDGHPLSTFSPFGVADHLSFFNEIPLSFEYRGRKAIPTMFGPAGLLRVIRCALEPSRSAAVSFTLEIHPTGQQLALGDAAPLFGHWKDKTNAEKTNQWLALLSENHRLLVQTIEECSSA